jgi:hypothetical protein
MYSRPLEFAGDMTILDLVFQRPETRFSKDVPPLLSLGLDIANPEHSFFAKCYMRFPADPSFCIEGKISNTSAVVSLPSGGAFPPRASILKQISKKLRRFFLSQKESR